MTFNIVAMICVAGMQPQDCSPMPGFSRGVAIIGQVSNEIACGVEAQQDLAKSAPFRNLAEGAFIKIMGVRNSWWQTPRFPEFDRLAGSWVCRSGS